MNKKFEKFDCMFKENGNGPYIIFSDEEWRNPMIDILGIKGNGYVILRNDREKIIDLREDMVVYDPRKEFPSLVNFENPVEKAKLEKCRKEVEEYINNVGTGVIKPEESSLGKPVWPGKRYTRKDIKNTNRLFEDICSGLVARGRAEDLQ